MGSSPAAVLLSFGGAADRSQGHTDEVGVPSGGGRAGGGGVSFWPYAPRAPRPRRRLDQQTPRASDDRVWRSPGHWACARVVGSAAAHPGACAVGLCTRARNSWAQSTPFLQPQLTRQFLREDHVDPGDGRPLRCLLPPTRGRGAHARLGRGGGSGASGEDPGELFLHPSSLVPSLGLRDGQVPPCLRFSPQPRNLLPPGSP